MFLYFAKLGCWKRLRRSKHKAVTSSQVCFFFKKICFMIQFYVVSNHWIFGPVRMSQFVSPANRMPPTISLLEVMTVLQLQRSKQRRGPVLGGSQNNKCRARAFQYSLYEPDRKKNPFNRRFNGLSNLWYTMWSDSQCWSTYNMPSAWSIQYRLH